MHSTVTQLSRSGKKLRSFFEEEEKKTGNFWDEFRDIFFIES